MRFQKTYRTLSIFIIALLLFTAFPLVPAAQAEEFEFEENHFDIRKIHPDLVSAVFQAESVEGIGLFGDVIRGYLLVRPGFVTDLKDLVRIIYVTPQIGEVVKVFGWFETDSLVELASLPSVLSIAPDRKLLEDNRLDPDELGEPPIAPALEKVAEIIGVDRVWDEAGLTGEGVSVAVIDTGIDYSIPDLQDALLLDDQGNPLTLDTETWGLVWPFYPMEAVDGVLPTAGQIFFAWDAFVFKTDPYSHLAPWFFGNADQVGWFVNVPVDINVAGISSASGVYRLGWNLDWGWGGPTQFPLETPVLYVDSTEPGVYDTVYIDVSSMYKVMFLGEAPDYSFADETPYYNGEVVSEDFTGDGVPDFGFGPLGSYWLDMALLFGGGILPGWDTQGRYLDIFRHAGGSDHGTLVSSSLAGRGVQEFDVPGFSPTTLPGMAPGAKIIGINSIGPWAQFIEAGMFFAAGFNVDVTDPLMPVLTYSGEPRAQIVSNSWGHTFQPGDDYGFGFTNFDHFISAFMIAGLWDPDYPAMLILQAVGNAGSGYGTLDSPGSGFAPLTVGASTAFHWTGLYGLIGFPFWYEDLESATAGHFDNIAEFSSRGPTPLGQIKPDVVNVGFAAWSPTSSWTGGGDAQNAFTFWAGTSLATPLTGGVAALIIQLFMDNDVPWNPFLVKQIIMNTATDLNVGAPLQGAGRVNAYQAYLAAAAIAGTDVGTPFLAGSATSFENLGDRLERSWFRAFGEDFPSIDVLDASLYAGIVDPGASTLLDITVRNPTAEEIIVSADAYIFTLVDDPTILAGELGVGGSAFFTFDPTDFMDAAFLRVTASIPFDAFDVQGDHVIESRIDLVAVEWNDVDEDGVVDLGETHRLNYSFRRSKAVDLTIQDPYGTMLDPEDNVLLIYVFRAEETGLAPDPWEYTLEIASYEKTPWDWVSFNLPTTAIPAGEQGQVGMALAVPVDAGAAFRSGYVRITANNGENVLLPVSVLVPHVMPPLGPTDSIGTGVVDDTQPYDPTSVRSAFDWTGSYGSGDWRFFVVKIDDPFVRKIDVTVNWVDPDSSNDVFVLGPSGAFIGLTDNCFGVAAGCYLGDGDFLWHSTLSETSTRAESYPFYATAFAEDPTLTTDGYYTISIHNVLHGGASLAEPFTIDIEIEPGTVAVADGRILFTSTIVPASAEDPFFSVEFILGEELATELELSTSMLSAIGDAAVIGGPGALLPVNTNDITMYTLTVGLTDTGWTGFHHLLGYRQKTGFFKFFGFAFGYSYFQLDVWPHMQILLG